MAIHVLQGARSSSARSKKVREGKIEEEGKIGRKFMYFCR